MIFCWPFLDAIGGKLETKKIIHSSPKETQVLVGCIFFWRRVYISEPDIMYHLPNAPGKNLAKLTWHWVRVSDPGSTGKTAGFNLCFFWGKVYEAASSNVIVQLQQHHKYLDYLSTLHSRWVLFMPHVLLDIPIRFRLNRSNLLFLW